MIPLQFDSLTKTLPRESRRSALRALGGMLALVPSVAGAKSHQSSGGRANDVSRDGRPRRKHLRGADGRENHASGDVSGPKLFI